MDAGAERDVTVEFAVEDDIVGSIEHGWVTVGCGKGQQNAAAFAHGAARYLGVRRGDAAHSDRSEGSQKLFDRGRPQLGLSAQPLGIVRMLREMPDG